LRGYANTGCSALGARRGYGRVEVKQMIARSFTVEHDWKALRTDRATSFSANPPGWKEISGGAVESQIEATTFRLTPRSPWRAGGVGQPALARTRRGRESADTSEEPNFAFTREPFIAWVGGTASWHHPEPVNDAAHHPPGGTAWRWPRAPWSADFVLPGSQIRGALAHRTLFHLHRIRKTWAEDTASQTVRDAALIKLFGTANDSDKMAGTRSPLIIEDVVFAPEWVERLEHNSLDRTTGGTRTGALFAEEVVMSGPITVRIVRDAKVEIEENVLQAFEAAVADLKSGRLPLGARSSGRFHVLADAAA
jgi:hypothetical protein